MQKKFGNDAHELTEGKQDHVKIEVPKHVSGGVQKEEIPLQ